VGADAEPDGLHDAGPGAPGGPDALPDVGPGSPDGPDDGGRAGGRVQSLERALALLDRVAGAAPAGATVAELAQACGLHRATAWRLLATMEAHGYVERDPTANRYRVGFALARVATSAGVDGLVRRARPELERVAAETGETADLAVAGRHGVTYVDEVAPPSVLTANWLGREVPLHATSTGKALLAWLPRAEVEALLAGGLPAYTATTVTDRDLLARELARTRAQGYGVCRGELEPHLYGVSAPVLAAGGGRPYAVFSVWGPRDRVPESRFAELGARVAQAARTVARAAQA